jgi:hypothetical protein
MSFDDDNDGFDCNFEEDEDFKDEDFKDEDFE